MKKIFVCVLALALLGLNMAAAQETSAPEGFTTALETAPCACMPTRKTARSSWRTGQAATSGDPTRRAMTAAPRACTGRR